MPLNRLGMLLGQMGFSAVQRSINGLRGGGWPVYQRSTDEINANKICMPSEQMSRCFYKVCRARIRVNILKKNGSSAHPLTQTHPYSPPAIYGGITEG